MALKINTDYPTSQHHKGENRDAEHILYIVIHNTAGGKNYTALSGVKDYQSTTDSNRDGICPHYFVDGGGIAYQANTPLNASAHCGGGSWSNPDCPANNSNAIGIEMCEEDEKGTISQATENDAIALCCYLIEQYPTIKGIYRHSDVCGFGWKTCPRAFIGPEERINGSPNGAFANGSERFANFKEKVGLGAGITSSQGDTFMDCVKLLVQEGSKNKWIYVAEDDVTHPVTYGGSIYNIRADCSGLAEGGLKLLFGDDTIFADSKTFVDPASESTYTNLGLTKKEFTSLDDCKYGDILCCNPIKGGSRNHVEIYVGDGKTYNWGSTKSIQKGTPGTADNPPWQYVWTGIQGVATSGVGGSPTSLFASISGQQQTAIAEANQRIIDNLIAQGVDAEEGAGYVKMDFSKTIKDVVKYTNVHKLDGLQYHPNALVRKNFKQDYIVIVRKKLYFAASMSNEENYLRMYVLDNWNSINTNHSVTSDENSASVTLTGGTRVTCVNNASDVNYTSYEDLLNSLTSIDNEGESNNNKWRMSDNSWNSTTANVDYKNLINARQAKYGWRFAEKCDFEPMDELIIYSKSRYTKDESGKFIFNKIFFGFIESVQKSFSAGSTNPRIQISAKDQFKLLKQSYVNQSPSFFPGRANNGKVDISFDTDKFGSYILNEPLAYGLADATEDQLKDIQKKWFGQNVFSGQYADEILKQICSQAGIPDKYLKTRIEPIKKVPYLTSPFATSFDMYSASFQQRSQYADEIAKICFMEFYFDEEGNATFKIPSYVLGCNMLNPNNDYSGFTIDQFDDTRDKMVTKDDTLQVVSQFCTLVEPVLYTTTEGETLRAISQKFYGTINYAVEIQNLNIGQCQEYSTVKPMPAMTILILKFDVTDRNARYEYKNLLMNNTVTSFANRLYKKSIDEFKEERKLTTAYLTDPYIRQIPDEDIISFTMTDSDKDLYTAVDVQAKTFLGVYDNNPMTKIQRTVGEWSAILKFGVRVASPVQTPFIGSEDDAELLGNMMLMKSYAARYTASLNMIEDSDIKVGIPIRLFTYDEHPNAEDEEYVQISDVDKKQSIYYVNSISRSISSSGVSKMTLNLTAGRMLGQESIFDIMDSLYVDFYKEPKDQDWQSALSMYNQSFSSSDSTSTNTEDEDTDVNIDGKQGDTITIPDGMGTFMTYMGWQCITAEGTAQMTLKNKYEKFDKEGFGKVDKRYAVAMTTTFGQVGQKVDIYLENDEIINAVIADIKDQDDKGCNKYGHDNGQCVVEFVVNKYTWYNGDKGYHDNPGTAKCKPQWDSKVTKVVIGENILDGGDN